MGMQMSELQKYVLITCLSQKHTCKRELLIHYYQKNAFAPSVSLQTKIITKSIERLIDRELLIGYGIRTPHKWFIKEIRLTVKGKKEALHLLGEQQSLPFP